MKTVADFIVAGDHGSEAFAVAVASADTQDVREVIDLAEHGDAAVRRAAVLALPLLPGCEEPTTDLVAVAIRLAWDPDRLVRDAACFALAEQWREVDTPAVRNALAARLDDIDRDARCEALVGLAYRGDPRALPRVRDALSRPSGAVSRLELVAAGALSDPQLYELVLQHQEGWDMSDRETAEAAARLTDPRGPGSDLLDGVAELYRRRAHGEPDGDGLHAWHLMCAILDIAPQRATEFLQAVLHRVEGDSATFHEIASNSALASMADDVR